MNSNEHLSESDVSPWRVAFAYGDLTTVVEGDRGVPREEVAGLFPDYLVDPPAHADSQFRIVHRRWRYSLRGGETGRPRNYATFSGLVDDLEFDLTRRFMQSPPRVAYIHGSAALSHSGKAILVLGRSGTGKSALALRWCMDGRPVFGDDIVRLEHAGCVSAFKRLFEVELDVATTMNIETDVCPPSWAPVTPEIWVDPRKHGGWAEGSHRVGLIVLPKRVKKQGLSVRDVPADEALGWITASLMPEGLGVADCFDDVAALVGGARCCAVEIDDSAAAARELLRLAK